MLCTTVGVVGGDLLISDATGICDQSVKIYSNEALNRFVIEDGIGGSTDVPFADVTGEIIVNLLGGNDMLTVSYVFGDYPVPIHFDGGANSAVGDALVLTQSSIRDSATYNFVNENTGSIVLSGTGLITYTGLETITANVAANNVVFNYTDTAETITVSDLSLPGSVTLDSTFGESLTFSRPFQLLTINAAGGDDVIELAGGGGFNPDLVEIHGGAGNDLIVGPDNGAEFRLSGPDSGTVFGTINFDEIENLAGGVGDDLFNVVSGGRLTGYMDAGGGNNRLGVHGPFSVDLETRQVFEDAILAVPLFIGMESFYGSTGAASVLRAPELVNTWTISGGDGESGAFSNGTINSFYFEGFQVLEGGSLIDTIFIDNHAGNFTINAGGGHDILFGPNTNTTYTLTGHNSGTLSSSIVFESVEDFIGGSDTNRIRIHNGGSVSGIIDGGGGYNELYVVQDGSQVVNLQTSEVTEGAFVLVPEFANFEFFFGGKEDTLQAMDQNNSWTVRKADEGFGPYSQGTLNSFGFVGFGLLDGGSLSDTYYRLEDDAGFADPPFSIDGGFGMDSIIGQNEFAGFSISGPDEGIVNGVTFSNVENLSGGENPARFIFLAGGLLSGTLDGGGGFDELHLPWGFNHLVDLQNLEVLQESVAWLEFSGIEQFVVNPDDDNVLRGSNQNNEWVLSSAFWDGETGRPQTHGFVDEFDFHGFVGVEGGDATDTFHIGNSFDLSIRFSGSFAIAGGGGSDIIVGPNVNTTFEVNGTDSITLPDRVISATSVENVTGGNNVDQFIFLPGGVLTGFVDGGNGDDHILIENGAAFDVAHAVDSFGAINVDAGAILRGTNTLSADLISAGTVAPGNSTGTIEAGNVQFDAGSQFDVQLGGVNPGEFDQLIANGNVTIGANVTINLTSINSFVPSPGQSFTLIDVAGGNVTGEFDGWSDGITNNNFLGSGFDATINYQAGDGNDVVLSIADPNTAPTAVVDAYTTDEDTDLVVDAAAGVLSNDTDGEGDMLNAILVSDPSHGDLVLNSDGSFTYTPDTDYFGGDSFTYEANDGALDSSVQTVNLTINPVNDFAPVFSSSDTASVVENTTAVMTVTATDADLPAQTVSLSISGNGPDDSRFSLSPSGELSFNTAPDFEDPIDANGDNIYEVEIQADDGEGGVSTQTIQVTVLNQASITGSVFVDVNENGLFDANEPGLDGVVIDLLDSFGDAVLDQWGDAITATTSDGGYLLFDDLDPGTYQIHEHQPADLQDGAELIGSLGGIIVSNDTMQLNLDRVDAEDYQFAELGQELTSGNTAGIGFWQNKQGQQLITQGGTDLAVWLTDNFGNVFGDTLSDGIGDDGAEVAAFYKNELFKQKSKHSAGPAKVDAQFMATALATFFSSSNLAGNVATNFGFNVTATGIGTSVVNIGNSGAAFGVADGTNLTIMQILQATNSMTDQLDDLSGSAKIYDLDGDGIISAEEAALRNMANAIYSMINEI